MDEANSSSWAAAVARGGEPITDEMRARLYTYDPALPLDVRLHDQGEAEGIVEERFSLRGAHDERVPGVLVYRRDLPAPRPVLLIQHGLNAGKDDRRLHLLRRAWAQHGFLCVTVDAPRHGERAAEPLDLFEMLARPLRGLDFVRQAVVDLCRVTDYLAQRRDADTERLGYVGFSMSTFLGVQFVAVEPRVRAACLAMGGAGLFHYLVAQAPAERKPEQELVASLIDPLHYAPSIAPRPVLQVNGLADTVVPAALGHMLHAALREPKRMIWYPGGHGELPENTVTEIRLFLHEALDADDAG